MESLSSDSINNKQLENNNYEQKSVYPRGFVGSYDY